MTLEGASEKSCGRTGTMVSTGPVYTSENPHHMMNKTIHSRCSVGP